MTLYWVTFMPHEWEDGDEANGFAIVDAASPDEAEDKVLESPAYPAGRVYMAEMAAEWKVDSANVGPLMDDDQADGLIRRLRAQRLH